jgi:two-component system, NarL family, response regulator DesR
MNTTRTTEPLSGPIRVAIAEDQAMVLGALAALLERAEGIQVVAQVRNGCEALEAIATCEPDVLIVDIEMPQMNGLEVANRLKGQPVRVIVLTTFARPGYLRRAIDAGALGYLLKDSPSRELADAVRKVFRGERVINSELAAEALGEPDPLTDREREVLRLASEALLGRTSPAGWEYLAVPCVITSPRQWTSWAVQTAWTLPALRARKAGSDICHVAGRDIGHW